MSSLLLLALAACTPIHSGGREANMVSITTIPARALTVDQVESELWRMELRPPWRAPTAEETATVAELVPDLLRAARTHTIEGDAVARAGAVGLRVERWEVAGTEHLALTELPDQRRGAGAYLFSVEHAVSGAPWILWEAPHPYFDQRTGNIAAALYFNPPIGTAPAAFFTSSMHRYTQSDGKRDKRSTNPADPCHNASHLFNVATQAAAATFSGATVVQIHGFGSVDDDAGSPIPANALAVVSAGRKDTATHLSSLAEAALTRVLGTEVLLYPLEVRALGATTNVEMLGLAAVPGARFLHVELAAPVRDLLLQDPSLRDAFGAALFTSAADPSTQP